MWDSIWMRLSEPCCESQGRAAFLSVTSRQRTREPGWACCMLLLLPVMSCWWHVSFHTQWLFLSIFLLLPTVVRREGQRWPWTWSITCDRQESRICLTPSASPSQGLTEIWSWHCLGCVSGPSMPLPFRFSFSRRHHGLSTSVPFPLPFLALSPNP